jgi:hypothetical protein
MIAGMISFAKYRPFFIMGSIYLLLMQLGFLAMIFATSSVAKADFRMFYAGGYMVRTGQAPQIYDRQKTDATEEEMAGHGGADLPFNHPAYEALLFAVLSLLPYKAAFGLFSGINLVLLIVIYQHLVTSDWMGALWKGLAPMGIAGFLPVGFCIVQGQDSILLLFVLFFVYLLQRERRDFAAGLICGLGMFRLQLVIPLVLLLCFARRWRLLAGFSITCLMVAFVSIALVEPASWLTYPRYLLSTSSGLQPESQRVADNIWPTIMPNVRGLVQLLGGTRFSSTTLLVVTVLVSALLLVWAVMKSLPFELMIVASVLVSYHGYIHDSVLLLLPLLTCQICSGAGSKKRLVAWGAVLAAPTVFFVLHVPFAVLSIIYFLFLLAMTKRIESDSSHRTADVVGYSRHAFSRS